MNTRILADDYKFVRGNTNCETALAAGSLPASGSFVDVQGHDLVHIIIHLGAIATSDTPTFEVKCADAVDGTLDVIDSTALQHIAADDDDGEFVTFTLEVRKLPVDHHFLAVAVSGTLVGSYGDVIFLLPGRSLPQTQITAQLPAASQHTHVG